jgi:hypothetical protein
MIFIKDEETMSIVAKNEDKEVRSNTVEALLLYDIRYLLMQMPTPTVEPIDE